MYYILVTRNQYMSMSPAFLGNYVTERRQITKIDLSLVLLSLGKNEGVV